MPNKRIPGGLVSLFLFGAVLGMGLYMAFAESSASGHPEHDRGAELLPQITDEHEGEEAHE